MCFIHMIHIRIEIEEVNELRTTQSQENKLRYLGSYIGVIQAMRDGLRHIIVLWQICTQQEQRCTLEGFWFQVPYFHPNRCVMNGNLEFDTSVFQKIVRLLVPLNLKGLVLVPCLVIITIFPKDTNTNHILL